LKLLGKLSRSEVALATLVALLVALLLVSWLDGKGQDTRRRDEFLAACKQEVPLERCAALWAETKR
jgi:hypothetical protein